MRMRATIKILDVLGTRISKTKLASPLREDFIINMIVNSFNVSANNVKMYFTHEVITEQC